MFEITRHPVADAVRQRAHLDNDAYLRLYRQSVEQPDTFWAEQAKAFLDWFKPWDKVHDSDLKQGRAEWFKGGQLNVAYNCIDRHLKTRANQTAIIFEPDNPEDPARHITYAELYDKVNRMANVLLSQGVMRGDRVVIYLPMIPEAAYAMLACARIGAIHSIVFAGFSPDALANRINDCGAKIVITADTAPRGGRRTALKSNTDAALLHCSDKVRCLVVKHTGDQTSWIDGRDVDVSFHRHWIDPTRPFVETVAEPAHGVLVASATLCDRTAEDPGWATAEMRTGAVHLSTPAGRAYQPSPFDYAELTRILVVGDVARDDMDQVAAAYRELFLAANGGALGLFTAISRMRAVHERISTPLDEAGLPLFAQHIDAMDTGTLVDIFRAEDNSCLLGTDAVRDGIDVPGCSLRLIVFDRIPWPKPNILHRTRRKAFGGRGYDEMLTRIKLKQAYGLSIWSTICRASFWIASWWAVASDCPDSGTKLTACPIRIGRTAAAGSTTRCIRASPWRSIQETSTTISVSRSRGSSKEFSASTRFRW